MERKFTQEDQISFATLSGDWNPMHMDEVVARRRMFGRCVVHGVHLCLWALDLTMQSVSRGRAAKLKHLKAVFTKPVGVGEEVTWCLVGELESGFETSVEIELKTAAGVVMTFRFVLSWLGQHISNKLKSNVVVHATSPKHRSEPELSQASGTLTIDFDAGKAGRLFRHLHGRLPEDQLASILATTRLIGMECPGLRSVFYCADIVFGPSDLEEIVDSLAYRVTRFDARFNRVMLAVENATCSGALTAFLHPSQKQADYAELKQLIRPGEFARQRALVVGGSRGIGEVACKLLAAGDADVTLSYHRGKEDAEAVVKQICQGGGKAQALSLDMFADIKTSLLEDIAPTHLYYFATPFIFSGASAAFQEPLFEKFARCYVSAFAELVGVLLPCGLSHVFYPSSTALDELPADMLEYAAAKAAGETLCEALCQRHPMLKIRHPRLPRLATDQTATFLPVETGDLVSVILGHVRELGSLS
jgi:hypothetical protein